MDEFDIYVYSETYSDCLIVDLDRSTISPNDIADMYPHSIYFYAALVTPEL